MNWRVVFGLFGVYRHLIAKEPSCVFCVSLIVIDRGDGRIRSPEAIPLYDEFAKELGPDEIYGFLHGAEATWLRFRHVGDCTYHAGSTENESPPPA